MRAILNSPHLFFKGALIFEIEVLQPGSQSIYAKGEEEYI
tara:strand:+ start:261 stop:380 length:120 start_codon:yes stop_codon:yes gene_type:complete